MKSARHNRGKRKNVNGQKLGGGRGRPVDSIRETEVVMGLIRSRDGTDFSMGEVAARQKEGIFF